jgi:hypothetical protein
MNFEEVDEGDYCIIASAVPGPQRDGFVAAVIVKRRAAALQDACVAYRDDALAGGLRWPSPAAARRFALAMAQEVIRQEPHRLAC